MADEERCDDIAVHRNSCVCVGAAISNLWHIQTKSVADFHLVQEPMGLHQHAENSNNDLREIR